METEQNVHNIKLGQFVSAFKGADDPSVAWAEWPLDAMRIATNEDGVTDTTFIRECKDWIQANVKKSNGKEYTKADIDEYFKTVVDAAVAASRGERPTNFIEDARVQELIAIIEAGGSSVLESQGTILLDRANESIYRSIWDEAYYLDGATVIVDDDGRFQPLDDKMLPSYLVNTKAGINTFNIFYNPEIRGFDHTPAIIETKHAIRTLADKRTARRVLRNIKKRIALPVLMRTEEGPQLMTQGHNEFGDTYVDKDIDVVDMSFEEARKIVLDFADRWEFAASHDRARAIYAFLVPELRAGGWYEDEVHIPGTMILAEEQQQGKSELAKCIMGSAGHFHDGSTDGDENEQANLSDSINAQLAARYPWVFCDNLKRYMNSTILDISVTANGDVEVRVFKEGYKHLHVSETNFMFTSNVGMMSRDNSLRLSLIQLAKRTKTGKAMLESGKPLAWVKRNLPVIRGAIQRIVREYYERGEKRDTSCVGDMTMTDWLAVGDEICNNILGIGRVTEGIEARREIASDPHRNWLNKVGIQMRNKKLLTEWDGEMWRPKAVTASTITQITCRSENVIPPEPGKFSIQKCGTELIVVFDHEPPGEYSRGRVVESDFISIAHDILVQRVSTFRDRSETADGEYKYRWSRAYYFIKIPEGKTKSDLIHKESGKIKPPGRDDAELNDDELGFPF